MRNRVFPRIVFEGGLGSQLLPLIEALKKHREGEVFEADCSYFFPSEVPKNMIQRPWRLDRYGFDIDDIQKLGRKKQKLHFSKQNPVESPWSYAKLFASKEIPIFESELNEFLSPYGLTIADNFSAIHIRRGDYLKVSSKIITDEEVAQILANVHRLLDYDVFVISDSKISLKNNSTFKNLQKNINIRFHFVYGFLVDECVIHDLMRMANFLVCSNSTFSFSAAVLSKQSATSIAPIEFFDPQTMRVVNEKFRSAGNFFILNQN